MDYLSQAVVCHHSFSALGLLDYLARAGEMELGELGEQGRALDGEIIRHGCTEEE